MAHRRSALVLLLAALALGAAPTSLSLKKARALLKAGHVDDIYLAYASLKPGQHPDGDAAIGRLCLAAARVAMKKGDAPVALGLAQTTTRLSPQTIAAYLVVAQAALSLSQHGVAAHALDAALNRAPHDGEVLYQRAKLAEDEGEYARAERLYAAVPRRHARAGAARAGVRRMRSRLAERRKNLEAAAKNERNLHAEEKRASRTMTTGSATDADPAGLYGRAGDKSQHFQIVYERGGRDFAQNARYEGKVLDMFERAYDQVSHMLDFRPDGPFIVVLYTKKEFADAYSGVMADGLLGFYARGRIRMNRAGHLNDKFFETAAHELTHAFVALLAGGHDERVPVWLNEGLATYVGWEVGGGGEEALQTNPMYKPIRQAGRSIPLARIEHTPLVQLGRAAMPAYMKSRAAVSVLTDDMDGMGKIEQVIRAVGRGTPFRTAMADAFGPHELEDLDGEANALLLK